MLTLKVLVLVDFEATISDELTVKMGEVVTNVTKANEDGWLQGELRGKRGIFPATFAKDIPVYLMGDSMREPRSIRKPKNVVQTRKCEVAFAYTPQNEDELELAVGETLEIIREIEDGWWMGLKNGKLGAFPSNFVKEIFVSPKGWPKLSEAVFNKDVYHVISRVSLQGVEYCQVMFDYKATAPDELELKKGNIVAILNKETEDEGWWEGELNGRHGFFPDNFVMILPPKDILQVSKHTTTQKDLRSNPPTKIKLPTIKPSPPPIKEKPHKLLPVSTNGDAVPISQKQPEDEAVDQFDGLDVQTEKLTHPTANRAKPPQRRPPTNLSATSQNPLVSLKVSEQPPVVPAKPELPVKILLPVRPAFPKVVAGNKTANHKDEEPTVASLQAEIKELRMALELLQTRQE
uniref:SH3 domain containing 21 n=1 Tax=Poecilia latipinna TaxID=48699 RepID=A0A3B3VHX9_9TELE